MVEGCIFTDTVLDFSAPPSSAALINLPCCGHYIQLIGLNMVGVQSANLKCIPPIGCLQHVAPPLTNPGKSGEEIKVLAVEKRLMCHHNYTLEKASRFMG